MLTIVFAVVILSSVSLAGAQPYVDTWPPPSFSLLSRSERSHGEEGIPRGLPSAVKKRVYDVLHNDELTKAQQQSELERLARELVAKNAKSLKEHEEKHKKVEEAVKQEATGALRKMSDTAKVLEKRIRDDFDHLH